VAADPVLSGIAGRFEATAHRGPVRNVREPKRLDEAMQRVETRATLPNLSCAELVRDTAIAEHTALLTRLGANHVESIATMMFGSAGRISDATGATLDAQNQPMSWDIVAEGLSHIDIEFDEHGQAQNLQIVVHPEQFAQLGEPTPAQQERINAILLQKKREYVAKKRYRRLSRQPAD